MEKFQLLRENLNKIEKISYFQDYTPLEEECFIPILRTINENLGISNTVMEETSKLFKEVLRLYSLFGGIKNPNYFDRNLSCQVLVTTGKINLFNSKFYIISYFYGFDSKIEYKNKWKNITTGYYAETKLPDKLIDKEDIGKKVNLIFLKCPMVFNGKHYKIQSNKIKATISHELAHYYQKIMTKPKDFLTPKVRDLYKKTLSYRNTYQDKFTRVIGDIIYMCNSTELTAFVHQSYSYVSDTDNYNIGFSINDIIHKARETTLTKTIEYVQERVDYLKKEINNNKSQEKCRLYYNESIGYFISLGNSFIKRYQYKLRQIINKTIETFKEKELI